MKKYSNSFFQRVCDKQVFDIGDRILVHIGQFKYSVGIGPIEIKTVQDGVEFGEYLKKEQNKKVDYCILIDDIGLDKDERKKIKETFLLPEPYMKILKHFKIDENKIKILFESKARNGASHILSRKMYLLPGNEKITKEIVNFDKACEYERCVPMSSHAKQEKQNKEIYSIIDPRSGIPLILKEGPNPKCNLIIAYSYYKETKEYDSIISFYNAQWEQRLTYGAMVARELFGIEIPIIDFYYYEAEETPQIVTHDKNKFQYEFKSRQKNMVKKLLIADIQPDLKDTYVAKIEGIQNIKELKTIEKDIDNLCYNK